MYEATLNHYIDGAWVQPTSGKSQEVMNPAKNTPLATLGHASKADLDKALAASAFDTANAYLGVGVGEHMGYLFTALFTVMVALLVVRRWPVMAWLGAVAAIGVAFGMLEPFGVPLAATINAIAFTGWSVWALVLGVLILWRGRTMDALQPLAA